MSFWEFTLIIILELLSRVNGYRNHSALSSIVFTDILPSDDDVHSEYYFGKCATTHKVLVAHDHWTFEELKGKMIVRSWLDVEIAPNCVYLRCKSSYGDLVRYHAFKFNVCICHLLYNYGGRKYNYFYYEWYIPVEMKKELHWDLFFYSA